MTRRNENHPGQTGEFRIQEIIPEKMKVGDFHHPVMHWSMYDMALTNTLHKSMKGQPSQAFETEGFRELGLMVYNLQPIRLEVELTDDEEMTEGEPPVAPGMYDFQFRSERNAGRFHGIVVDEDGRFEPHMSAHAIYLAQVKKFGTANFDHVYIEGIKWDRENKCFQVTMGS